MASIKLSALISDIRGKSNGSYFAKRNNTIVMANNPHKSGNNAASKTSLQAARNQLAQVSGSWQYLKPEKQLMWNNAATLLTWFTKVGEPYTPTGYQYFNQCNQNNLNIGNPIIDTPSTPLAKVDMSSLLIIIDNGEVLLDWQGVLVDGGKREKAPPTLNKDIVIYGSWSNSYGTNYPKGGYKKICAVQNWDGTDFLLNEFYNTVFGTFLATGYSYWKIEVYDPLTGIMNGSKLTKADSGRSEA